MVKFHDVLALYYEINKSKRIIKESLSLMSMDKPILTKIPFSLDVLVIFYTCGFFGVTFLRLLFFMLIFKICKTVNVDNLRELELQNNLIMPLKITHSIFYLKKVLLKNVGSIWNYTDPPALGLR